MTNPLRLTAPCFRHNFVESCSKNADKFIVVTGIKDSADSDIKEIYGVCKEDLDFIQRYCSWSEVTNLIIEEKEIQNYFNKGFKLITIVK